MKPYDLRRKGWTHWIKIANNGGRFAKNIIHCKESVVKVIDCKTAFAVIIKK